MTTDHDANDQPTVSQRDNPWLDWDEMRRRVALNRESLGLPPQEHETAARDEITPRQREDEGQA